LTPFFGHLLGPFSAKSSVFLQFFFFFWGLDPPKIDFLGPRGSLEENTLSLGYHRVRGLRGRKSKNHAQLLYRTLRSNDLLLEVLGVIEFLWSPFFWIDRFLKIYKKKKIKKKNQWKMKQEWTFLLFWVSFLLKTLRIWPLFFFHTFQKNFSVFRTSFGPFYPLFRGPYIGNDAFYFFFFCFLT